MNKKKIKKIYQKQAFHILLFVVVVLVTTFLFVFTFPNVTKTDYNVDNTDVLGAFSGENGGDDRSVVVHVPEPENVRAIYMTSCVAGTPSSREDLVSLIEETELNSLVIDIKDYSGTLSFEPKSTLLQGAWQGAQCGARDMREFLDYLHKKGIYVIGRITVFQDPYYSELRPDLAVKRESDGGVWRDYKGLSFIDVGAKEYWDYIVELSKESYNIGFDELNFDYIRFPSDGNMKDIAFTHTGGGKAGQLERFFEYLHTRLVSEDLYKDVRHINTGDRTTPVLSADLFGMTTTNTDDLNIGQVLERAFPYFDYIAPMVYPSHYPTGFNGWKNPNLYPYEVVNFSMKSAVERALATTTAINTLGSNLISTSTSPFLYSKEQYSPRKLRTWIQDFDYGGNYDIEEVRAQIEATYDAGLTSWMIWSPSNRYTKGALLPASPSGLEEE